MPELPEVETVCRGLNQLSLDQKIEGVEVLLDRTLVYPLSIQEFRRNAIGAAIDKWHRRGKYLLARLVRNSSLDAGWLGIHLRMSGQLLWTLPEQPLQKHTRIRLFLEGNREIRFVDQRTFGKFWWIPPGTAPEIIIAGLQKLGPEPFSTELSREYLARKLLKSDRAIKTLLLDQTVIAGLGNIYADEVLFKSQIKPETIARSLTLEQIDRLQIAIIEVLQIAIEKGGTTFNSFLNVTGVNGNYSGIAWVYGRAGKPCRICQTPIERIRLVGRSAHFCPRCQH